MRRSRTTHAMHTPRSPHVMSTTFHAYIMHRSHAHTMHTSHAHIIHIMHTSHTHIPCTHHAHIPCTFCFNCIRDAPPVDQLVLAEWSWALASCGRLPKPGHEPTHSLARSPAGRAGPSPFAHPGASMSWRFAWQPPATLPR